MFSDKMKARIGAIALAGAALAITPAAASAGVVVKSSGPSAETYPVGRQVSDSASITLRSGDRITVLTDSGTRVMSGPGTFRVGEGATRTRGRFTNLTRRSASRRVRTGAVRGAPVVASRNIWHVNIAAAGNICLYDLDRIRLWRAETDAAQTVTITDTASQASLAVPFFETEDSRALPPGGLAVSSGGNYSITTPAAEGTEPSTVSVTFVALTEEYETPNALAQALIANGCTSQLALLADTMEASVPR